MVIPNPGGLFHDNISSMLILLQLNYLKPIKVVDIYSPVCSSYLFAHHSSFTPFLSHWLRFPFVNMQALMKGAKYE